MRGMNTICMASVFVGEAYRRTHQACLESRYLYQRQHGYANHLVTKAPKGFDRPLAWLKLLAVRDALLKGHEYVFFLDADALITNPSVKLEDLMAPLRATNKSMYLALEAHGGTMNTGSFFVRNHPRSLELLEWIWRQEAFIHHPCWEQEALLHLHNHDPEVRRRVLLTDNCNLFNSFPYGMRSWRKGDFLIHFAGTRGEKIEAYLEWFDRRVR